MEIIFDMPEQKPDDKNKTWEILLKKFIKTSLKDSIDADQYINSVLDEMWANGENVYASEDGTPYYYEISKHDTKSGLPVVVSL